MGKTRFHSRWPLYDAGDSQLQRIKVAALPSPKRLPAAQGFGRRGYAQAGGKLFQHPCLLDYVIFLQH
jgi:hypothetical protein